VKLLRAAVWRLFHPRRTIKPTRDGWWCLFVAVGLGVAAINTGNNLLYLLVSALLALIVVSGILSEQAMRGLALTGITPEEVYAGRPALLGATLANRKRWLTSYSVTLELLATEARALESGSRFMPNTISAKPVCRHTMSPASTSTRSACITRIRAS